MIELIVNADDFGLTEGVNQGVVDAHHRGVVTSTTLMVRMPAAEHAVALARDCPDLGIGLHVDLGEWAFRDGEWHAVYQVVDGDDPDAVATEVAAQLQRFEQLVGRLPTHLDSHQHVHRGGPAGGAIAGLADRIERPLRGREVRYMGDFYGQLAHGEAHHSAVTVDALIDVVAHLEPGVTELGCHPGYVDGLADTGTMYVEERVREVAVLCDERVRRAIDERGVRLRSFADLAVGRP